MVVSLSQYKYGNRNCCCASANELNVDRKEFKCKTRTLPRRLNQDAIIDQVDNLRNSLDIINDLLEEISGLSCDVRDEISDLESFVAELEAQL